VQRNEDVPSDVENSYIGQNNAISPLGHS